MFTTAASTAPRGAVGARFPTLRQLGPNWYAVVMGTAIVATAGAGLPVRVPGLRSCCVAVWGLSVVLLVVLLVARSLHHFHHREQARAHLLDPAVGPFYGCLAMALTAVGTATLAVGGEVLGEHRAVVLDTALFVVGTALALVIAAGLPVLLIVRRGPGTAEASPVWLLPVVAPMVSAAAGPPLVPYLPAGQGREALLLGCYAMFGMSLLATLALLPLILGRLLLHGPPPLATTPLLFLVLGPLGQSATAVGQLAEVAPGAVPAPYAAGLADLAVLYGVPVLGFALLWLAMAGALVVRALRRGMRFSMTWWAFTFPVGTCATGAAGLARHAGLAVLRWPATALFALLVVAWGWAAARTLLGLVSGALLAAPPVPAPTTARTR